MASRSMLDGDAKGFAVATVAVAVTGEAIALVTKTKEDRVRPQGSPVWSDYLKPGEKISEILASQSSHPFSPSPDITDPLQRPISGSTDGAKSDPFLLVDRDTYLFSDHACEFLANVEDVDAQLENLQELNYADGPTYKIKDDSRVTRMGSYLRVHSFDELSQFLNVLTGDMSIVGPRSPPPAEAETYNSHEMGKLVVPQGLTGFWQVCGRSDTSREDNVQYDLDYIREFTPWVVVKRVVNTIIQVFTGQGAY